MYHDLSSSYLNDLVPSIISQRHSHNKRTSSNLETFFMQNGYYFKFFLPSVKRDWNDLNRHICEGSIYQFKAFFNNQTQILCYFNTDNCTEQIQTQNQTQIPCHFNTHNRTEQIHHCRLRLERSSLNSHLFHKKILQGTQIVYVVTLRIRNIIYYTVTCIVIFDVLL